jgi:cholera toxin transcriptional activator
VTETQPNRRVFRFGIFELDEATGELRREGKAQPRLRDQSLRVLLLLLARPKDVVTREELRETLWDSETFVDFDHGMNAAINQLRGALGDSAANPRFIQTLPRLGYRFIAPVESVSRDPAGYGPSVLPAPASGGAEPDAQSLLSTAAELPRLSSTVARTLFALLQTMYLAFYVVALVRLPDVMEVVTASRIPARLILWVLIVSAAAGIPVRLYLLTAAGLKYRALGEKFLKLFPFLLPLDELWALAPFLLVEQIGAGAAIGATAALLYLPFAQRSLLLMDRSSSEAQA